MRRQTQTDHCSNRKPLDLRTVAPAHTDEFWIMRNLQSEFGHTGRMVWIKLGCTCTREWHLWHVQMAKTKTSLRIRYIPRFTTFLRLILFTWNVNLRKVWPNKTLVSLRIIAVSMVHLFSNSMVHLFSKSLASLERCMREKELIRIAYASLIDRCIGAPGAQ